MNGRTLGLMVASLTTRNDLLAEKHYELAIKIDNMHLKQQFCSFLLAIE